jgi:hypothetical protein
MYTFKNISLIIFLLLGIVTISSCDKEESETWGISTKNFVFIEHSIVTQGQLLQTPYDNDGPHLEFPTYSYNAATKVLTGLINFNITDDLKVVLGNSKSITGFAGSGTASGLTGLTRLPYKYEQFEISKVDADGTAYINYKGEAFVLKSGENWSDETSEIVTQQHGDRTGKINKVTTDKITNFGIWEKTKIVEE